MVKWLAHQCPDMAKSLTTPLCACIECSNHKQTSLLNSSCRPSDHEPSVISHLSPEQQQVLNACLEEYQLSLLQDLNDPSIQVATGINDLINDISCNPFHYDSQNKFPDSRLSQVHAQFLYDISQNFVTI